MKILLMVPLVAYIKDAPIIPDLGLGYIATYLKRENHQVFLRDWNMEPSIDDFKEWLRVNKPEMVGIKIFTKDVFAAKKTLSIIKEVAPETIVVIGGPHPSGEEANELMTDFPECDVAIKGEAEHSLPALVGKIEESKQEIGSNEFDNTLIEKIPGLVWRDYGQVYSNPVSFTTNLDDFDFPCRDLLNPADYSLFMYGSDKKDGNGAPIITTRGCPGKCTFCSAYNVNGKTIRYRSPENVFEEIMLLYTKYNVRRLLFNDNCFTSNLAHLTKICELLIESKYEIEWDCSSYERLDNLNSETLSMMKKAGCIMIHLGVESGSEKIRKSLKKRGSLDQVKETLKLIKESGMLAGAWFILGFPDESKKDMKDTIRYAHSLGADMLTFTPCFPLPGTEVYEDLKERYKVKKIDWSTFKVFESEYPMSELNSSKLFWLIKIQRLRLRLQSLLKRFI